MALLIVDATAAQRYEAHLDGELAGVLEYIVKRGRIALVHTEVAPNHEGRGIAGQLARFALDEARRRGLRVIPVCPYVRAYLERHPEDGDIVVGAAAR
jgi:predicted GNAT family acetyltransferase